jgi:hypothetical protein
MSGLARRLPFRFIAGKHARLRGPEDLRRACLTALIALVVQFSLGMILNLYVTVPSSDAHASYIQEVEAGPFALTIHALLGVFLIWSAAVLLVRAIGVGDPVITALAGTGLTAILGAFAAGEIFVRNGQNSASLWMAILTGVALVSYVTALNLVRVGAGQSAPSPQSAPSAPYSAAQHALPRWDDWAIPQPRPTFGAPPGDDVWGNTPW